jgi:hypothetical protein
VTGEYKGRMSQWGTQTCALQSMLWPDITRTFYEDTDWDQLHNLLLDGNVDSEATYAWTWTTSTAPTRTMGGSHDGNWHWTVKPLNPGGKSTIRQDRPFTGKNATTYHADVAFKCLPANGSSCSITWKVIAVTDSGSTVTKSLSITEPRDGVWRVYRFDPTGWGVDHVRIKFTIVSKQQIGIDAASLTGPYGGK